MIHNRISTIARMLLVLLAASTVLPAAAQGCGPLRINAIASDRYTNRAVCAADRELIGVGSIEIAPNGYLELARVATAEQPATRLRCENNGRSALVLRAASSAAWPGQISAAACQWQAARLQCASTPAPVCVAESIQPVRQTLALHAMVQVKQARVDDQPSELPGLRAWVEQQGALGDFCRALTNVNGRVAFSLIINSNGAILNPPDTSDTPRSRYSACIAERLARGAALRNLRADYVLDWVSEAP